MCSPGTDVGIDVNGDEDGDNTETCYPTKGAAFVEYCNHPDTNVAEMLMKIEKVIIVKQDCTNIISRSSSNLILTWMNSN